MSNILYVKEHLHVIHMIGKPEWFKPRKFGWGLGLRSKEGIIYVLAFVVLFAIINNAPIGEELKLMGTLVLVGVFLIDTLHIMLKVYGSLDEREQNHHMLAETNASYVAVAGILVYALYLTLVLGLEPSSMMVLPLLAILISMSLAKGVTLFLAGRDAG